MMREMSHAPALFSAFIPIYIADLFFFRFHAVIFIFPSSFVTLPLCVWHGVTPHGHVGNDICHR